MHICNSSIYIGPVYNYIVLSFLMFLWVVLFYCPIYVHFSDIYQERERETKRKTGEGEETGNFILLLVL